MTTYRRRYIGLKRSYRRPGPTRRVARIPQQVSSNRLFVKLPYWTTVQIVDVPLTSIVAAYLFSINSIYDPDLTSTGHQPRGADQWFQFYSKYIVHGCRYNVRFYTSDTSAVTASANVIMAGTLVGPKNIDSAVTSDIHDFMEMPFTKDRQVRYFERSTNGSTNAITPYSSKNSVCKGYVSMKRLHKDYRGIDYDTAATSYIWPQDYMGKTGNLVGTGTAPAAEQFLALYAMGQPGPAGALGAVELPNIYATVKLTYYVEYFDLQNPSLS